MSEDLKMMAINKTIEVLKPLGFKFYEFEFTNSSNACFVSEIPEYFVCNIRLDKRMVSDVGGVHKRIDRLIDNKIKILSCINAYFTNELVVFKWHKNELQKEILRDTNDESVDYEKIMQRIDKLLSLSNSPNVHEAERASAKAQELLAKYNLELDSNKLDNEIFEIQVSSGKYEDWKLFLASVVADNYRCRNYSTGAHFKFVGFRTDVLVARKIYFFLYEVAVAQCNEYLSNYKKEAKKKRKKVDVRLSRELTTSYYQGFIDGVSRLLYKNCRELMLIVPSEVNEHMDLIKCDIVDFDFELKREGIEAYKEGQNKGELAISSKYIEE